MINILVVDDSKFMQKRIAEIITSDQMFQLAGTAANGQEALDFVDKSMPDIITLDLEMPVMNGMTFIDVFEKTYKNHPKKARIILLSSLSSKDSNLTFEALEKGAFDFVHKPSGSISLDINKVAEELISKIKQVHAERKISFNVKELIRKREESSLKSGKKKESTTSEKKAPLKEARPIKIDSTQYDVLLIGSSTGGPQALRTLLPMFPGDFPLPICVVQHMPEGFTKNFADHLDHICSLNIKEAQEGDILKKGQILIAPGSHHINFSGRSEIKVHLSDKEKVSGHRPSVDEMFHSFLQLKDKKCIALIMTGMGADGAKEITNIAKAGHTTIAQDESTCVVFGMPKVAIALGKIKYIEKLGDIYSRIETILKES